MDNVKEIRSAHFIGIGGAGMSGIALVLHERGCKVTGSDLKSSNYVRKLEDAGIEVTIGHDASTIDVELPGGRMRLTPFSDTFRPIQPVLLQDIDNQRNDHESGQCDAGILLQLSFLGSSAVSRGKTRFSGTAGDGAAEPVFIAFLKHDQNDKANADDG